MRPSIDSASAAAVGGTAGAVEAGAAVADEHGDLVGVRLGVDRDLVGGRRTWRRSSSPRAPRARAARAARRAAASPALASSIAHAVQLLDLGRRFGERVGERAPRRRRRCRRASGAARAPADGRATETRGASPAWRWTSASVCSTESWMRAATSARSCSRIRSLRSAGELPDPRPEDEQQRAGERARRDERARRADVRRAA